MLAGLLRKTNEPARDELVQPISCIQRGQAGDPPSTPCHDDLGAPFDAVEVLAEAVVQSAHSHLELVSL